MNATSGKINALTYSSYMKFMRKNLNPVKAMELYNGIKDESAKNNVFISNSVLSCLVRNGKFDSSIKMLHQMKQDGLMPDVVTYSMVASKLNMVILRHRAGSGASTGWAAHGRSLLNAYLISGNYRKADELVQDMKSAGLVPNKVILTTLLKVYVREEACLKNQENYWLNWKLWPMRMKRFISRPLVFCKVVEVWKG
ncbi:hypothetical protein ACJW31_07G056100 [Castanea mollissima]